MLPQVSETHPLPDDYLNRGFHSACIILKRKGVLWVGPVTLSASARTAGFDITAPDNEQQSQATQKRIEFTNSGGLNSYF
jgi:hypothetical protein